MGNNIKQFRTERGVTLTDLSLELGLSISTISKLENGLVPVSEASRQAFEQKYPDYDFAFDKTQTPRYLADRYKDRIAELENVIMDLRKENEDLRDHLDVLYRKINNAKKVLNADIASVRIYESEDEL